MKKISISLAFLAGVFFSACGSDSSNNAANGGAEGYCDAGSRNGYVQFSQDTYSSPVGAGVYVYDCAKSSATVEVTLTSSKAGGSLKLTLKKYDLYYYAPFSMGYDGAQGGVLLVDKDGDVITVSYNEQYDYANVTSSVSSAIKDSLITISFDRTQGLYNAYYFGYIDKAVIHLTDETIQNPDPVWVNLKSSFQTLSSECTSSVQFGPEQQWVCMQSEEVVSDEQFFAYETKVALYPVSDGNNSERIGFVEFVAGDPGDGQAHVEPAGEGQRLAVTATYTNNFGLTKTAVAMWVPE
jgi:hypothetical protein